jgi:hypothetical protein
MASIDLASTAFADLLKGTILLQGDPARRIAALTDSVDLLLSLPYLFHNPMKCRVSKREARRCDTGLQESHCAAWLAGGVSRAISNKQVQSDWFPTPLEEGQKRS